MTSKRERLISIVLPLYNEQTGIAYFHKALKTQLSMIKGYQFEIIYCDDGSTDGSIETLHKLAKKDIRIRVVCLSRNFGKEIATTAGMQLAKGEAIITLDSDAQHPVELLSEFIAHWENGSKVVIGLRTASNQESVFKRLTSRIFYKCFNVLTGIKLMPGATDYRLIDKTVQADFARLTERNRITRGLIDWLGYEQTYIMFTAKPRLHDSPAYSYRKLMKLAIDSVISLSSSPLYITAYIGAIVLPLSLLLGLAMALNAIVGDPLSWDATGGAFLSVFILCLVGILLVSQGVIGLYLSHIHSEAQNRPLFIIDRETSRRI